MLIQGEGKTLQPVKCFIREEKMRGDRTDQVEVGDQLAEVHFEAGRKCGDKTGSGNPFIPGGAISEDGALILELWRLDRLGQYGNNCQEVTSSLSPPQQHLSHLASQPVNIKFYQHQLLCSVNKLH